MSRFWGYLGIVVFVCLFTYAWESRAEITSGRATYDGTASHVYLGSSVGDTASVEIDSMAVGATTTVAIRPGIGANGIAFTMYVRPIAGDAIDSLSAKVQVRWVGNSVSLTPTAWQDVLWFPAVSATVTDTLLQVVWKASGVTADAFAELAFPDILNAGNVSADFAAIPLLSAGSFRVQFWIRADHDVLHDESFNASVWATVY